MTTNETILLNLNKKIEELKQSNKKAMEATVPCWTEIEHDRGMIDGLEYAIKVMDVNIRDCKNCKYHTENGCVLWDCQFEPKEGEPDDKRRNHS